MPYIDIGANLTHRSFKECLVDVLADAHEWSVDKIVLTGTSYNIALEAKELTNKYKEPMLFFTCGVHPHNVKHMKKSDLKKLEELAEHPKCVAIGECGLDYNRMFSCKEKQLFWFEEQIKLAIKLNKPLFLHEREAEDDFYNLLYKYKQSLPKTVVHCFTGNLSTLKKYIELGCYIGITGWINDSRRNHDLIHALKNVEQKTLLDKLMIETDCPFLSPVHNDSLCVPSYVYYVLEKLSKVLEIDEKDLENIVFNNTTRFFNFN
jgi:TatD DNase family protein